ncbi:ATP synthase subunit d, mitochondrial-like [Zerene cesonia]|uniref:ATP synthase subunit d, mitochondrial-like n=1 Tax=Zerene cesonia TaxID=33412 RepID=UPI0018E59674|nr:ATP synthase subunit d, mitochondrial-like [Zerene cesonia]
MAKRLTKPTINWKEFDKLVPPDQRTNFLAFKAKSDNYLRRVQANPAELPKIDWKKYEAMVPVAGLVEKFKKDYEGLKVPYPVDNLTATIDEQWKTLQPEIKAYCDNAQKEIEIATKELEKIKSLPKFEDITMEMFYDLYPNEALDPVKRPTFWPHDEESQLGYEEKKAKKDAKEPQKKK